jgi:hypothetical protein
VKNKPQLVVKPGKQTNKQTYIIIINSDSFPTQIAPPGNSNG